MAEGTAEQEQRSLDWARKALAIMESRGIEPKPENFAVWFRYCSGQYPELKRTLDALMQKGIPFTDERNTEIFEQFFGVRIDEDFLSDATLKLEEELKRVLNVIGDADSDRAQYGEALSTFSGFLDTNQQGLPDLRAALTGMLKATRAMERQGRKLEDRLNTSAQQIQGLKEDLRELQHEVMTDALTGISNRRRFDQDLRVAAMDAMEEGHGLCLLMIDIDHFKSFNDDYGHQIGDQVLRLVARILTDCVRGQDITARYGGEEFSVVLHRTNLNNAAKVADHIRERVSSKKVINRMTNEDLGKITVSIGVSQFIYGEPLDDFIQRADASLYLAKQNGRDRVVSEVELEKSGDAQQAQA